MNYERMLKQLIQKVGKDNNIERFVALVSTVGKLRHIGFNAKEILAIFSRIAKGEFPK